jgi:hypothetical protein
LIFRENYDIIISEKVKKGKSKWNTKLKNSVDISVRYVFTV